MAWVSPTGHQDPDTAWTDETYVYDEMTGTGAESIVPADDVSSFLILEVSSLTSGKVRFWAPFNAFQDYVDLDVDVDGAWVHVYQGTYANLEWVEKAFTSGAVTKARVRFWNEKETQWTVLFMEFDFWSGAAHEGAVTLSGTGTLASIAHKAAFGVARLTGTGVLTTLAEAYTHVTLFLPFTAGQVDGIRLKFQNPSGSSLQARVREMDFLVTSNLVGRIIFAAKTTLTGTGVLSVVGQCIGEATVTLSGSGTLSAATATVARGETSISGEGTLTANGRRLIAGATAALTGTGTLSAVGWLPTFHQATVTITGTGVLSTLGGLLHLGQVAISGTGVLTAAATAFVYGQVTLTGTGLLVTLGNFVALGKATVTGEGVLAAIGRVSTDWFGAVTLTGTGELTTTAVIFNYATVPLSGTGTLAAVGALVLSGKAPLTGTGTLTAATEGIRTGIVALYGRGDLVTSGVGIFCSVAALFGMGTLVAFSWTGPRSLVLTLSFLQYRNMTLAMRQSQDLKLILRG